VGLISKISRIEEQVEQKAEDLIMDLICKLALFLGIMLLISEMEHDEKWSSLPWKVRGEFYVNVFMDLVRVVFLGKEPRFLEEGRRTSLIDE